MKFEPTAEQRAVRSSARKMYDLGQRLVGEWCRSIPQLTVSMWLDWENQDGFMQWWCQVFPEHSGTTFADLRALEFETNRALMAAVAEGDISAAKLVIQMISAAREAKGSTDTAINDWFAGDSEGNGWVAEA